MVSITNPEYHLPYIFALQRHQTFETGANKPLLISGVDSKTYEKGDFVLKYIGSERMSLLAFGRELMAAFIARQVGLNVPDPAVVEVSVPFAQSCIRQVPKIVESIGLNFGSKYLVGSIEVLQNQHLTLHQQQQAAAIFFFDILIRNPDRTLEIGKPNLFQANGNLFAIDHELAFSFLDDLPFFANKEPWKLNELDVNLVRKHFFFPLMRRSSSVDWDEILIGYENLTAEFWSKATYLLPLAWQGDQVSRIKNHFNQVLPNLSNLKSEIWNLLQ